MNTATEETTDVEHEPLETMSRVRLSEMLDYATVYGEWDENTPDGAISELSTEPMGQARRDSIVKIKQLIRQRATEGAR